MGRKARGNTNNTFKAGAVALYDPIDGDIALTVIDKDTAITLSLPPRIAKKLVKLLRRKTTRPLQFNGATHLMFSEELKKNIIKNLDNIIADVEGTTY